jgi:phosphopantothenoylcysteine decarboxylase/phosphopantothenate--cysteine ligase
MQRLRGREVVLGVGAGIAAYKSCELLRRLQDRGFLITVIPTKNSLHFVGKATWEALSHRPVRVELWDAVDEVPHINIGKRADLILIAPATADLISRIASGRADDLLTATILGSNAPMVIVPAMHPEMWLNAATQSNVEILKDRGHLVMEPDFGRLTGSDIGIGRFPEVLKILDFIEANFMGKSDLLGKRVVITGGGTREPIDPVRYIGNRSSGKQASAIGERALARGASVTMIMGPNSMVPLEGANTIDVETAMEMNEALLSVKDDVDILIMTAAVADARPMIQSSSKIKKDQLGTILLEQNPDLLEGFTASKRPGQIVVGFAAETESETSRLTILGKEKLIRKGVDLLFVNDVSEGKVFGADRTSGFLIDGGGSVSRYVEVSKYELADRLLDAVKERLDHE